MPDELDDPSAEPDLPKRPLYARRWFGWVAAVIATAVAIGAGVSDHNRMVDRVSAVRDDLTEERERNATLTELVDSLETQLEDAKDETASRDEILVTCVTGLSRGVKLYNNLVKQLNAIQTLSQAQADSFFAKAKGLRAKANRSLADCREAVGVT